MSVNIISILCAVGLILCCIALVGNDVIYRLKILLGLAVHRYNVNCLKNHTYEGFWSVNFGDIKDTTIMDLICPWRWRIEKFMPEDKLEILKPYLKEVLEAEREANGN